MDEAANFVIQSYAQDTVHIQVDSILTWYKRLATFEADLILAKHYFFEKDFNQFDLIWNNINEKYQPKGVDSLDYVETTELYTILRPYLSADFSIRRLPSNLLSILQLWGTKCGYAGAVTRIILKWNSIYAEEDCDSNSSERRFIKNNDTTPNQNSIQIYPNPANEQVTVVFNDKATYRIFLKDTNGKIISQKFQNGNISSMIFPTNDLMSGLYFLEIIPNSEGIRTIVKIVIIH